MPLKTCSKCGETKPLTEFHRESKNTDGRRADCKECRNEYSREYHANYVQTDRYRKSRKKYKRRHPNRIKARNAVTHAVHHTEELPPASSEDCTRCGGDAVEYHHHNGYSEEHWLDVVPVCKKCHGALE